MRLLRDIYLVGSGLQGFGVSNRYDCSVYLVDGGSEAVLVDAGSGLDGQRILDNIREDGVDLGRISTVLLTHAHADHAGGVAALVKQLQCRVLLHEAEADALETADENALALEQARRLGYYPPDYRLKAARVDMRMTDGEVLEVGRYRIREHHTPGHSCGSVCYVLEGHERRAIFTGDSFFPGGKINLLNCVGSSLADYREHSRKLSGMDLEAMFPGHFAFSLSNAQLHLDQAIAALEGLLIPPMAL